LQEHLVSEGVEDDDYYVNRDTLDAWQQEGGDAGVVALLRRALGERTDMDIRWEIAD
jgi:processive 1,2-diacylglycerol beta-glucosyltransferase